MPRLDELRNRREAVLLAEIGALLHAYWKCSAQFLQDPRSGRPQGDAQDAAVFGSGLVDLMKDESLSNRIAFCLDGQDYRVSGGLISFVRGFNRISDPPLKGFLGDCHAAVSADEKGVL